MIRVDMSTIKPVAKRLSKKHPTKTAETMKKTISYVLPSASGMIVVIGGHKMEKLSATTCGNGSLECCSCVSP